MLKKIFFLILAAGTLTVNAEQHSAQFKDFIKHCIECSREEDPLDPQMQSSMFNWEFEGKYKVVYADKKFFSYLTEELSYTGGAHGDFKVSAGSLYRRSGKRITVRDIAPAVRQQKKLLQCVTEKVAEHFKCSVPELSGRLRKAPFLTENFYMDARGITFIFNEYEIAAKGAGAVRVRIPFEQYKVRLP